jgi:hypothetical protein
MGGKFGKLMTIDVYGNKDFEKERAVVMPPEY